jgi:hypothetical protein
MMKDCPLLTGVFIVHPLDPRNVRIQADAGLSTKTHDIKNTSHFLEPPGAGALEKWRFGDGEARVKRNHSFITGARKSVSVCRAGQQRYFSFATANQSFSVSWILGG